MEAGFGDGGPRFFDHWSLTSRDIYKIAFNARPKH